MQIHNIPIFGVLVFLGLSQIIFLTLKYSLVENFNELAHEVHHIQQLLSEDKTQIKKELESISKIVDDSQNSLLRAVEKTNDISQMNQELLKAQYNAHQSNITLNIRHNNCLKLEDHHDQYAFADGNYIVQYWQKDKPRSCDYRARSIIGMIKALDLIFREHNIPYFLYGGTLIGYVREKRFIRWDKDGDIVMFHDTYYYWKKLLMEGLVKLPDNHCMIIRQGKDSDIIAQRYVDIETGYYIDIFVAFVGSTENHNFPEKHENVFTLFTKQKTFHSSEAFPIVDCSMNNITLKCPQNPEALLKHYTHWQHPDGGDKFFQQNCQHVADEFDF